MAVNKPNSILNFLGYEVLAESDGVYHLRLVGGTREFIAVLHAEQPLTGIADELKLLSYEVESGVSPQAVMDHWKILDARQLEESGIEAQATLLSSGYLPEGYVFGLGQEQLHQRPQDRGVRSTVTLTTGEVVSYN